MMGLMRSLRLSAYSQPRGLVHALPPREAPSPSPVPPAHAPNRQAGQRETRHDLVQLKNPPVPLLATYGEAALDGCLDDLCNTTTDIEDTGLHLWVFFGLRAVFR